MRQSREFHELMQVKDLAVPLEHGVFLVNVSTYLGPFCYVNDFRLKRDSFLSYRSLHPKWGIGFIKTQVLKKQVSCLQRLAVH